MNTKSLNKSKKKPMVVAVSGGFDPIHPGHIRMIQEAAKLGDRLVVILNNDHWLKNKKGYVFMPQAERAELLRAIRGVDDVFLTKHTAKSTDKSICKELKIIRPDIFVNGGDRTLDNIPEAPVCEEIGCKMLFNLGKGGKVQSSSWLLKKFLVLADTPCFCGKKKKYKRCHGA